MPVLVEALSVVIRARRLDEVYPGGWNGFVADAPNETLCSDGELARLGFMEPKDVNACLAGLEAVGLIHMRDGLCVDMVVVDQRRGPTSRCPWIEFGVMRSAEGDVAMCRLAGSTSETLVTPDGWTYANSLSHRWSYEPMDEP